MCVYVYVTRCGRARGSCPWPLTFWYPHASKVQAIACLRCMLPCARLLPAFDAIQTIIQAVREAGRGPQPSRASKGPPAVHKHRKATCGGCRQRSSASAAMPRHATPRHSHLSTAQAPRNVRSITHRPPTRHREPGHNGPDCLRSSPSRQAVAVPQFGISSGRRHPLHPI
jgi:hypothetical protein